MRKGFIVSAILAILIGAASIYWASAVAPSILASIIEKASLDFGVPIIVQKDPGLAVVKKYSGQSLEYLGSAEIVAKYPKDFVDRQRATLLSLIDGINQEPNQIERWIDLGLIKKAFDNYAGARDAWEYAKLINPNSALNYYNLGNLYGWYIGDLKKAETNYREAIKLAPRSGDFYLALAGFYQDVYKEKSDLADDVLLDGMKNTPKDSNIIMQLAYHYKSAGDKEGAIKYFSLLLNSPNISGAQQQAFEEEIAALGGQ